MYCLYTYQQCKNVSYYFAPCAETCESTFDDEYSNIVKLEGEDDFWYTEEIENSFLSITQVELAYDETLFGEYDDSII